MVFTPSMTPIKPCKCRCNNPSFWDSFKFFDIIPTFQGREVDWPNYKGNEQRTGFSVADGPIHGRTAWKFPVGLA